MFHIVYDRLESKADVASSGQILTNQRPRSLRLNGLTREYITILGFNCRGLKNLEAREIVADHRLSVELNGRFVLFITFSCGAPLTFRF